MLNVVIIGAGNIAKEHIKCFRDIDGVSLSGIVSRTADKARRLADEFDIPLVADDIEQLYAEAKPDLVVVTVNIQSAYEILSQCIPYKVPILTEKPIALNYTLSQKINSIADEYNTIIWVGLNRRAYSTTRNVYNELNQSIEKRTIQVFDQQDLDVVRKIGHPDEVQKYWMYANSIHLIDYLSLFGRGNVSDIQISSGYHNDMPATVCATLRFDSGDIGIYTALWGMPGPWGCFISTQEKRWELQPLESLKWCARGSRDWQEVSPEECDIKYKPGFYHQAHEIVEFLLYDKPTSVPLITEALRSTELVSRIYNID